MLKGPELFRGTEPQIPPRALPAAASHSHHFVFLFVKVNLFIYLKVRVTQREGMSEKELTPTWAIRSRLAEYKREPAMLASLVHSLKLLYLSGSAACGGCG